LVWSSTALLNIPYFKSSKQENIEEVMKVEGESLSIEGFCSQQYIQAKKVWCKSELLKECNLEDNLSFSGPQWRLLTTESNQRVILKNSENGCIYFFMPALQVEDSGIYWFGILDGLHITHLRKIKHSIFSNFSISLNVQESLFTCESIQIYCSPTCSLKWYSNLRACTDSPSIRVLQEGFAIYHQGNLHYWDRKAAAV
uniref:Ig-like domain-containing protein n=1 Tax=Varanus komodoensis TaxID=61221 RepID=A0A8D2KZC6_VARKO